MRFGAPQADALRSQRPGEKYLGVSSARDRATHRRFIGAPHGFGQKLHRGPASETIFGHFPRALDEDMRC